jgi:D-hexose-6-phosphate mutarotase
MAQSNDQNGSRLDRIEALTLEIAAANLRHDRAIDQNKAAIARHDEEFSRINATFDRIAQQQNQTEAIQQANAEQIALNQ